MLHWTLQIGSADIPSWRGYSGTVRVGTVATDINKVPATFTALCHLPGASTKRREFPTPDEAKSAIEDWSADWFARANHKEIKS